jgi:uncharacterized protein with FMN-binding domain
MAQKTPRRLVALSSAAITTIYLAGYLATRGADVTLAAGTTPVVPTTVSTVAAAPAAGSVLATTPGAAPSSTGAQTGAYRDGTYSGSGTSRRGGVQVAVTVRSGRIATVQITNATTEYPASRIASLPAQVVSKQSGQVDRVTGATYSSQAFQQAVQQALAQAQA